MSFEVNVIVIVKSPDNDGGEEGGEVVAPQYFTKTLLLNSTLSLAKWFQLKKNLFCNITWSSSPVVQLNYVVIYHLLFHILASVYFFYT